MNSLSLEGVWDLRDASAPDERFSAPVPGSIHDALLAAGRLPDAHHGYNERDQLWVGDRTWIYARSFDLSAEDFTHEHLDLVAEGLDTFCSIRVNGQPLGTTDNMFRRWRIPAKALLRPGANEIELIFTPAADIMKAGTGHRHLPAWNEYGHGGPWGPVGRGYVRKQACQFGWDWGMQAPSAGPWLPLRLEAWSAARIEDWRLEQRHLPDGSVELALYVKPNAGADLRVAASFSRRGETVASVEAAFYGGYEWISRITNPALWWPNGMGEQPLHDLVIELRDAAGNLLDSRHARIGLRQVELVQEPDAHGRSFYFRVNGRPFFAKGSNWIPLDAHPSARNLAPRYRRDLESAAAAHMNMLRVWGGGYFSHDVFYDLCDELGILVWQDLMFGCGTYPTWDERFLDNVWRETVDQARRLRHHACLACWCGNNELEMGFCWPQWEPFEGGYTVGRLAWASYLELFDRVLPSALRLADPGTPYLRGSPHSAPEEGRDGISPRSGDHHSWEVWFTAAPFENYRNHEHRFLSEFGFQALPDAATLRAYAPAGETLAADSAWLAFRQRSMPKNARILEITGDWFGEPNSFERLCLLSQLTQGQGLKIGIEHWRRLFPRVGGATYWQINDRWAAPTWATLDVHGNWKASHHLARAFFAPLLVLGIEDRENHSIATYVVNDHAEPIDGTFSLVATDCAGAERACVTAPVTALGESRPTEIGVFALAELLAPGRAPDPDDLLVWLRFTPADPGRDPSENLVLFARPRSLRLARPELTCDLQPADSDDASLLTIRTGDVPALWVHLERPEIVPAALQGVALDVEFFHLPPHTARTVRLRHPGRSAPSAAELPLASIADYLLNPS